MRFELQPTLRGGLLELRPLRAADFDALYAVASDPLIWEQHPVVDRWKPEIFREFFEGGIKSGGAMVMMDLKDARIVGSSRFNRYDEAKGEIEIGWTFLARSHWGGVYNREMKRLMLNHAFRFVNRVTFSVGIANLRSQRAMEKIGGKRVGTKSVPNVGEHYIYEISANGFELLE
jgi:RimJ/RimL family protein N-acetyltransferase